MRFFRKYNNDLHLIFQQTCIPKTDSYATMLSVRFHDSYDHMIEGLLFITIHLMEVVFVVQQRKKMFTKS